ncbi:hypothetical protein BH10ACT10_BH10ACT10_24400 [soil metagenome]
MTPSSNQRSFRLLVNPASLGGDGMLASVADAMVSTQGVLGSVYGGVVANSGYYGAGMHIAPAASVTDGVLDVIVVRAEAGVRRR